MSNRKRKRDSDGVYIRTDSPHRFWITWKDAQGRRRRRPVEAHSIEEAKTMRAAEMTRVEKTKVLGFAPPSADSFEAVAARFLAYQKARLTPAAYDRDKGITESQLKKFFAGRLADIRRADVQRYITERTAGLSAYTVQKELNVVKHLLRLAVEWELIPVNPAQGVKSPRVPAGRVRYLQPGEFLSLLQNCPEWLRPIAALGVTTGMRRGEILNLRWLDVDFVNSRVLLPQTKNGDGRAVYLNRTAGDILRSLPGRKDTKPTERVFPGTDPFQVSMAFHRTCQRAKIEDFRFHDLRHTAASWLRMKGADIHTVAQLLGHKDLRMTARYSHLSPGFLAEAVKGLDRVFGKACHSGVTGLNGPKLLTAGKALK